MMECAASSTSERWKAILDVSTRLRTRSGLGNPTAFDRSILRQIRASIRRLSFVVLAWIEAGPGFEGGLSGGPPSYVQMIAKGGRGLCSWNFSNLRRPRMDRTQNQNAFMNIYFNHFFLTYFNASFIFLFSLSGNMCPV